MTTKKKLLLAAQELFCKKGYHSTTIRDISNKAKVNVSMISYHFKGKEELYIAILETNKNIIEPFDKLAKDKKKSLTVRNFVEITLREIFKQPQAVQLLMTEQSLVSTEKTKAIISDIKTRHYGHFCKLFSTENKKSVELSYYSIFGMIKELFRAKKIVTNAKEANCGYLLEEIVANAEKISANIH